MCTNSAGENCETCFVDCGPCGISSFLTPSFVLLPLLSFSFFLFSISCSFYLAKVIFMIVKPECKCTKHGTCDLNGHCLCDVGWFGPTCSRMHYLER